MSFDSFSHFSLLLGCALPIWMSSGFNDRPLAPFAGILSLGIGDTMVSLVDIDNFFLQVLTYLSLMHASQRIKTASVKLKLGRPLANYPFLLLFFLLI